MNKQQLQDNNTDLSRALSLIGDLPIKALVEAAASQGKYVWRKRISAGFDAITYQWDTYDDSGIWYSADTYVISSKLTLQDLDGATMTSSTLNGVFSYEDGALYLVADGNKYASNDTGGVNYLYISSTTNYEPFVVSKPSTYEYVVSNSESAYPDGGTQDGYYYERVSEGVTGIDYGMITLSQDTTSTQISHSLGVVPSRAYLVSASNLRATSNVRYVLGMCGSYYICGDSGHGTSYSGIGATYTGDDLPLASTICLTLDKEKINFDMGNGAPLVKGSSYYWIAIA